MMSEKIRIAYERTPLVLRPLAIGLPLLLVGHFFWTLGQNDAGVREAPPYFAKKEKPSLIPQDLARRLIEEHPKFQEKKQAAAPWRLPDNYDTIAQYPLVSAMQRAGYLLQIHTPHDTWRNYELTSVGRQALAGELREEAERYVVNIARRKLVSPVETSRESDGSLSLKFEWKWEPLHAAGREMDLRLRGWNLSRLPGHAKVVRRGPLHEVAQIELWASSERDYMRPIYY